MCFHASCSVLIFSIFFISSSSCLSFLCPHHCFNAFSTAFSFHKPFSSLPTPCRTTLSLPRSVSLSSLSSLALPRLSSSSFLSTWFPPLAGPVFPFLQVFFHTFVCPFPFLLPFFFLFLVILILRSMISKARGPTLFFFPLSCQLFLLIDRSKSIRNYLPIYPIFRNIRVIWIRKHPTTSDYSFSLISQPSNSIYIRQWQGNDLSSGLYTII